MVAWRRLFNARIAAPVALRKKKKNPEEQASKHHVPAGRPSALSASSVPEIKSAVLWRGRTQGQHAVAGQRLALTGLL